MADIIDGLDTPLSLSALRILWDNVHSACTYLTFDGTICAVNRSGPTQSRRNLIGANVTRYMPDEFVEPYTAALAQLAKTGTPQRLQLRTKLGDHWESILVLAGSGAPGPVLGLGLDVSSKIQAEDALAASERKFAVAVESTGLGTWSWHAVEHTVSWDERMLAIAAITKDKAPTDYPSYLAYLHPDDRDRIERHIFRALETKTYPEIEHRILCGDGKVRWIQCRGQVLTDESGAVTGMIGGALDVTEQHFINEQLRQAQKLEAVGQLTAGVAHNFNNLLMAILPNLQIGRPELPAPVRQRLEVAERAVHRAAELVEQMLAFTRIGTPNDDAVANVAALAKATAEMCRQTFDSGIDLEVSCPSSPVFVRAIPPHIEQVFLNLLLNARDAVAETATRHIKITVRIAEERSVSSPGLEGREVVRVVVADTGAGMDELVRERAFEPFFTTKPTGSGTGLGLFTAYGTIRELGGAMFCTSETGRGTEFTIKLPTIAAPDDKVMPAPGRSTGTETVLVVDDDDAVRKTLGLVLDEAGYNTIVAESAETAWQLVEHTPITLAILDYSMPGTTGFELASQLLDEFTELRVIVLSGYALDPTDARIAAVIRKPISADQLLSHVRRVLDDIPMISPTSITA